MPFNTDTPEKLEAARASRRKHYRNNKKQYYDRIHYQHEEKRLYITSIKKRSKCTDCGNPDWRVLEFDHLRDKIYALSNPKILSWSYEKIDEEISKCEVVCGNCHKIRTYERKNRP